MSFHTLGHAARGTLACALIMLTSLAHAAMAPSPSARNARQLEMLDARVNLKGAYVHATAARPGQAAAGLAATGDTATAGRRAFTSLHAQQPSLSATFSPLTGAPTSLRNTAGWLTPAAPGRMSTDIATDFLARNRTLFGFSQADLADLVVLGDSAGGTSGLRMLRLEQQINGRPVFQSQSRFLLDRDGRLAKYVGQLVPHARASITAFDSTSLISPQQAVVELLAFEGKSTDSSAFRVHANDDGRLRLTSTDAYVAGDVTARQVLFPLSPGMLVPSWSLVVFTTGQADWYAVIDAQTGDVLWRKNIRNYASTQDARFRVYVQADGTTPADSPAPQSPTTAVPGAGTQYVGIAPTIVRMHDAYDPLASPNGWIDDCPGGVCTADQTQTLGNNVLACLDMVQGGGDANKCDTNAAGVLDGNGRPTGNPDSNGLNRDFLGSSPRDFQTNFLPAPQGGNPEAGQTATGNGNNGTSAVDQFRRGVTTHLFYSLNWFHDKLYALGFDEDSGNFQQTNFSGMGLGNDRVNADVTDGSDINNANFSTPPDGTSGRMQMYRFTGPSIDRDGSLDAEIFFHEAAHGVSNRLVGDGAGLNWAPARGLGEGWSDFIALSLLNHTQADDPDAAYASGAYATYKLGGNLDNYVYGIRRFPYSTDNSVNPITWADVDDVSNDLAGGIAPSPLDFNGNGGAEVHNIGEIWALSLWEMRSRIIADPNGANGDVPTGNHTALQLVIDGLKMTPLDTTFTQARDALLDADCTTHACANEEAIWGGFADRGLGYGAASPFNVVFGYTAGHIGVHESFATPHLDVVDAATDVAIDDSASNNNGVIDPGEPVRLNVSLSNPWRTAAKAATGVTATLSSSTPGVTIYQDTATYGAIAAQAKLAGTPFLIGVDADIACGSAIDFSMTTTSSLGTTTTRFQLRVGAASGTDPVITYSRNTSPALAIPDGTPRAVFDQLTISDDVVIADLDLRLDNVTHTFTGDLTAMLRSPHGIGVDSMALIGGLTDGGPGDNLVNMLIDDDQPYDAAHDMVQATGSSAPFSSAWLPVFNAPWPALAGFPVSDPVGTFARYDGTSSKGIWSLALSDQFAVDSGALNAWSILVTPVHFTCSAFTAAANVSASKTVAGSFAVGGTVTYTVILTNTGTGSQGDNPGDEFTDVLPAGLTLVSATASSGTATTSGNTASWNGTLAPLGGSTTITLTATIDAGMQNSTISNQGTLNFDADGDGSNESSALTDDPALAGGSDPTRFTVSGAMVTATKSVGGSFVQGGTVVYTVVLSNSGTAATLDNTGDEFTDVLPGQLILSSAVATSGSAVAIVGSNTVTWNGSIPAGGSVTLTINASINAGSIGSLVNNQGSFAYDADLDGSNESTGVSDDPTTAAPNDATAFTVDGAIVTASKTVSGDFRTGGDIVYTIVLNNSGPSATSDNPGDELTDSLPPGLLLNSASASSGVVVANLATRTVTWNGGLPAGGSATISIDATIGAVSNPVSNQANFVFDANLDGSNESAGVSDDPTLPGANDATIFEAAIIAPVAVIPVPSSATWALLLLLAGLALIGGTRLRKRKTVH